MPTPEQRIRAVYGFDFPDDFFRFREFLAGIPADLLGDVCDMYPAHPFTVADGDPATDHPDHPIWEGRYYHDLPEFVTVFTGTTDGLHWGYFFDAPGDLPPIVAHYWHGDTFQHALDGDTIFEAVRQHLEYDVEDFEEMAESDPDEAESCRDRIEKGDRLREELSRYWGADRPETGGEYLAAYDASWRKPVAPTWSRLGIVVPKTWYRPLSSDTASGNRLQWDAGLVETLAAEAMTALREGCPGSALKLGHDLWVWANDYPVCYDLLEAAYTSLDRGPLIRLLHEARAFRAHCDSRRR